jgi:hypothetical protein
MRKRNPINNICLIHIEQKPEPGLVRVIPHKGTENGNAKEA